MPYRICKTIEIENGHMLTKHPDRCKFPHGHSRRVEFVIEADDLDKNDMVCDFKIVREAIADFLDQYDHAMCMNTDDPKYDEFKSAYGERVIGFTAMDPTTEVLARTIHDHFKAQLKDYGLKTNPPYPLRDSVRVVSVRVWETSTSWAEYSDGSSHSQT
ncbi:MAG TPA: 6-carboxytetrahydropterin synthase [Chthoniobacterales bacterium]|nr:6-carboxytetrahydropterin synthase [Chthoniobacterales bacterium]